MISTGCSAEGLVLNEDREVCDTLAALAQEEESPLGNVTFQSLVSVLPVGVPYSHSITVGLDGTWGVDPSASEVLMNDMQTQVHKPDVLRLAQFVTTLVPENVTRT